MPTPPHPQVDAPVSDPVAADVAAIRVEGFSKAYRETVAVEALSFEVHPGQILGLLGPNGAGKTTTLRTVAGILAPTEGRIEVAGWNMAEAPREAKARLAYVPDDPHLFDALTVWEHLQFVAAAYGVDGYREAAEALLEQLELTDHRDKLAQELSRGMRQKVALACAYLHDPPALLLDEPMTGLDPHGIRILKRSVRERSAAGSAVVVSSHLLSLIEDLCTHLLVMDNGRALFHGPADEARTVLGGAVDASLEAIFFHLTGPRSQATPEKAAGG